MLTITKLIALALTAGYRPSKFKKHQGVKCPACGRTLTIFYHVPRTKPKIAACVCGFRKVEGKPSVILSGEPKPTSEKVDVGRCKGITKKGKRCKKIAHYNGYCKFHVDQGR